MAWMLPQRDGGGRATGPANRCQRGRIRHLKMGWTDRGIMKLLTSKQAAESPADGRADGERAARLGCEQDDGPDFSWMLIEWSSQAPQHVLAHCVHLTVYMLLEQSLITGATYAASPRFLNASTACSC
ncbi:hypothetical protein F2P81_021022 [Scophthalmus maximus]|uniref:Uncharacterized protein n=1 Tax=Scophthalmus maximus TaxID=52904 RepID=A0A6A4S1Z1_SCOMX|nr:hypothetical protein F2P81_021022 [Scophthalmus maximus]